jgi:hypothetical protein
MRKSIFHLGTVGDGEPWAGMPSGIPVYYMTREQVDMDRSILKKLPTPPGMSVSYPYIVKIDNVGEYVVQADGTASFYSYKYHRWEPPQQIDTKSMWAAR